MQKLAAEAVALDHLSHGRVVLGVGIGDSWDISLRGFSEEPEPRQRGAQLDEALEVLVQLWSGEPVSFAGQHVTVTEVRLLPRPVQQPRIPIWIGGRYPNRGPISRAARWDGACLFMAHSYTEEKVEATDWSPDDLRRFVASITAARGGTVAGFDICVGGRARTSDPDADRALIQALAEAGATWCTEWIPPADRETMQAAIERGPLR